MNKNLKMISLLIILVLVAGLSYFLLARQNSDSSLNLEVVTPTPPPVATSTMVTSSASTPITPTTTTSPAPVPTTPTSKVIPISISFDGPTGGCGNIFVHKINLANTAGISVSARKSELNLSAEEKTFAIGQTEGVYVEISLGTNVANLYCNDVLSPEDKPAKKLIGKSGQAIISIDQSTPSEDGDYLTTVILKDVKFFDEAGNSSEVTVDETIFKDVKVGWLPG